MGTEAFFLGSRDLLMASLSVNVCLLLQVILSRLIDWAIRCVKNGTPMLRTFCEVHHRWPSLLGRVLMEQITLVIIIVIILSHVSSVSIPPFSQQPLAQSGVLIRLVFNASTARLIVMIIHSLFGKEHSIDGQSDFRIRHVTSLTDQSKLSVGYLVFCIASNIIYLGYRQNLILGLTTPFMELGTVPLIICRLIKFSDHEIAFESYRKFTVLNLSACIVTRFVLPFVLLSIALSQESPLAMDYLPLTWFFIAMAFHSFFHIMLFYLCVKKLTNASFPLPVSSDQRAPCVEANAPFSIHNYPNMLSNDINDTVLPTNKKEPPFSCDIENVKPAAVTKLKDLNYGFLRSYDNRNLYSNVVSEEDEKMNFHRKKSSSKYVLLNSSSTLSQGIKGKNNYNIKEANNCCFDEDIVDPNDNFGDLSSDSRLTSDSSTGENGTKKSPTCTIHENCYFFQGLDENTERFVDRQSMSLGSEVHFNETNTSTKGDFLLSEYSETESCSHPTFQDLDDAKRSKSSTLDRQEHNSSVCTGSDINNECTGSNKI